VAKIHHFQLFGLRKQKYNWLLENDLASTKWKELKPESPFHLFIPYDTGLLKEYEQGCKITDIMPINTVGVVTGQDEKTIAYTKKAAEQLAQSHSISKDKIQKILYRPFDERFIVYDSKVVTRPRQEVMRHMLAGENLGLITVRQQSVQMDWSLVGATNSIIESSVISNKTAEINYLFPIYLFPNPEKPLGEKSVWPLGKDGRQPNLDKKFVEEFSKRLGMEFVPERGFHRRDAEGHLCPAEKTKLGPEDVFNYIYAVFHSPEYRKRYAEFLKIDFPRAPMTSNKKLFAKLCELGDELVRWHLLEPGAASRAPTPEIKYPVPGENRVEKGFPKYSEERVYINKEQYFEPVPEEVWNFYIGGYQVLDKWLKDRKGRDLSHEDLEHYRKIVAALSSTIRLMAEIDKAIDSHGGWPIK